MAGPYPQYPDPIPSQPTYSDPTMLPPPLEYPQRRTGLIVALIAVVLAVVGAAAGAVVYALGASGDRNAGALTDANAQTAIQNYLDALSDADVDAIARNTLCGMYDAVRDRRSDIALAQLSSDTFRDQFSQATVTSIDKKVFLSANQAQVLFTMRVQNASGSSQPAEEQAVAHVLLQDDHVFVCQYLARGASDF